MDKKYSQTIVEMLKEDTKNSSGTREVLMMFLSRKDEIENAITHGWTIKSIWQTLHSRGLFSGKYDCFARYVRVYIKHKTSTKEEGLSQTQVVQTPTEPPRIKPYSNSGPTGFNYNPQPLDPNDL